MYSSRRIFSWPTPNICRNLPSQNQWSVGALCIIFHKEENYFAAPSIRRMRGRSGDRAGLAQAAVVRASWRYHIGEGSRHMWWLFVVARFAPADQEF
jgi:hypothetical protein